MEKYLHNLDERTVENMDGQKTIPIEPPAANYEFEMGMDDEIVLETNMNDQNLDAKTAAGAATAIAGNTLLATAIANCCRKGQNT